jgi:hypothetical protein
MSDDLEWKYKCQLTHSHNTVLQLLGPTLLRIMNATDIMFEPPSNYNWPFRTIFYESTSSFPWNRVMNRCSHPVGGLGAFGS